MSDVVTLEQAEEQLASVTPILAAAKKIKREIEMVAAGCDYDAVLLEKQKAVVGQKLRELSDKLEQLDSQGCYVRDLDIGIIDFQSTFEGREVFLCWKLGEEHIMHWHEINQGCNEKKEIVYLDRLDLCWTP